MCDRDQLAKVEEHQTSNPMVVSYLSQPCTCYIVLGHLMIPTAFPPQLLVSP